MTTVLGQYGFMIATGLRIFRISKVYEKYNCYVESQKHELSKFDLDASHNNIFERNNLTNESHATGHLS